MIENSFYHFKSAQTGTLGPDISIDVWSALMLMNNITFKASFNAYYKNTILDD